MKINGWPIGLDLSQQKICIKVFQHSKPFHGRIDRPSTHFQRWMLGILRQRATLCIDALEGGILNECPLCSNNFFYFMFSFSKVDKLKGRHFQGIRKSPLLCRKKCNTFTWVNYFPDTQHRTSSLVIVVSKRSCGLVWKSCTRRRTATTSPSAPCTQESPRKSME